jgi:hypothetical protein
LPIPKYHVRVQQPAHKNERRGALDAAAANAELRSNGPQTQPPFPAARVKHTAHTNSGTTSEAHSTARVPLQPHLQSSHATPRHTLFHYLSPAPQLAGNVHTGGRSDQSMARGRHTGENEAHSPQTPWSIFHKNGAEGWQR